MRYLNKIVYINSASVQYAEIELDGNVHLIGTQGVGKSTLLRAILFFYNANKTKLGIPREKKGFDDYYFQYQNSYIIYEIIKDNIPFCVLAYKVNGKVAFRFFNSEYKRELFIDEDNRAFENWDKIYFEDCVVQGSKVDDYISPCSPYIGMNILSVNPSTIICDSAQVPLMKELEKYKIDCVPIQFRHGMTLAGGLHCATLDLRRNGNLEDYCS